MRHWCGIGTLIGEMNGNRDRLLAGTIAVAVAVLALVAAASAEKPVSVQVGSVLLRVNDGYSPKAVSRAVPTPVAFTFSASIRTADGTHPPALNRLRLELDKDSAVDVRGLPTCNPKIQYQSTRRLEEACAEAIVGSGQASFEIAFPEQVPTPDLGRMTILNGGVRGAVTTLYARTDISIPTPAAIVFTIKIKRLPGAHTGSEALISIPKVAGGSGSLTLFNATIGTVILHRGQAEPRRHPQMPGSESPHSLRSELRRRHHRRRGPRPPLHPKALNAASGRTASHRLVRIDRSRLVRQGQGAGGVSVASRGPATAG